MFRVYYYTARFDFETEPFVFVLSFVFLNVFGVATHALSLYSLGLHPVSINLC